MPPALTKARFAALAEAFGGAIERWPAEVQAEARDYAAAEPEAAQAELAAARALDAVLDRAPAPAVSSALKDRALAAFEAQRAAPRKSWRLALPDVADFGGLGLAGWDLTGWGVGARGLVSAAFALTLALGAAVGYGGGRALVYEASSAVLLSQSAFGVADVFGEEG